MSAAANTLVANLMAVGAVIYLWRQLRRVPTLGQGHDNLYFLVMTMLAIAAATWPTAVGAWLIGNAAGVAFLAFALGSATTPGDFWLARRNRGLGAAALIGIACLLPALGLPAALGPAFYAALIYQRRLALELANARHDLADFAVIKDKLRSAAANETNRPHLDDYQDSDDKLRKAS